METLDRKVHQATILQLLEQIEICNAQIKKYLQIGEKEDSLPIRQEKHLKNQYLQKLDAILNDFDVHLSFWNF